MIPSLPGCSFDSSWREGDSVIFWVDIACPPGWMMCSYHFQRRTSFSLSFHPLSPYRMENQTLYPVTFRHLLPRRLRQFTPAFAAGFATLGSTPACSPSNSQLTPAFCCGFCSLRLQNPQQKNLLRTTEGGEESKLQLSNSFSVQNVISQVGSYGLYERNKFHRKENEQWR